MAKYHPDIAKNAALVLEKAHRRNVSIKEADRLALLQALCGRNVSPSQKLDGALSRICAAIEEKEQL